MSTTAIMKISTLDIGSYINAASTNYTFTIAATIPIPSTSRVRITFPPEIAPPASADLVCNSNTISYINSITC